LFYVVLTEEPRVANKHGAPAPDGTQTKKEREKRMKNGE
jgi:hypothetical protein